MLLVHFFLNVKLFSVPPVGGTGTYTGSVSPRAAQGMGGRSTEQAALGRAPSDAAGGKSWQDGGLEGQE